MDNLTGSLPKLSKGASCSLLELKKEQCFTQPPSRYSEASLVKALESNGVGRPSTFASIVKTILDRSYVSKEKSSLVPTELGFRVNDFLVERFPDLFNVGFTAEMEKGLDEVEEGKVDWVQMLRDFYGKFQKWVAGGGARLRRATYADAAHRFLPGRRRCGGCDFGASLHDEREFFPVDSRSCPMDAPRVSDCVCRLSCVPALAGPVAHRAEG